MTASIPVRKLWPLLAMVTVAALSACTPKPTEEPEASSAADPAALHTPADDVAGRDSAAALEAAMAASPSAVDLAVQSASASQQATPTAPATASAPEHATH